MSNISSRKYVTDLIACESLVSVNTEAQARITMCRRNNLLYLFKRVGITVLIRKKQGFRVFYNCFKNVQPKFTSL